MSNRDFVQSLYDAFAEGDAATVLGAMHPEIQWNEAEGSPLADGNPYSSPEAVGEGVFGRLMNEFDGFAATPGEMTVEGDKVVVQGRYTGTHRETGADLDAQFAHVWTVEDGKVTRFQQYTDTAQHVRIMGSG